MNRFVANKIIKNQKVAKLRLEKMYCLISSDECYVYFTGQWESRTGGKSNWNNKPKSINQLKKESGEYLLDAFGNCI